MLRAKQEKYWYHCFYCLWYDARSCIKIEHGTSRTRSRHSFYCTIDIHPIQWALSYLSYRDDGFYLSLLYMVPQVGRVYGIVHQ